MIYFSGYWVYVKLTYQYNNLRTTTYELLPTSKMFKPVFIVNENMGLNWEGLSANPNAIHILEQNLDKVDWVYLSQNLNAIPILEKNLDKVCWLRLSQNPNAIHLLAKLDTNAMRENCQPFAEELVAYVFHPLRLENMANEYGYELDEYMEYL